MFPTFTVNAVLQSLPVRANLVAWWQGDNALGTSWPDNSGNGNNATGGGGSTVLTGALNGHSVVQFNGSSQYFTFPDLTAMTVIMVAIDQAGNPSQYNNLICFKNFFGQYSRSASSANWEIFDGTDHSSGQNLSSYKVTSVVRDGSTSQLWTNGTSSGSFTYATTAYPFSRIGYDGSGTQFLSGRIAEIVVYSTALTTGDRVLVQNYLKAKYGL